MRASALLLVIAAGATGAAGCGKRQVAYHFRAPLVSGVFAEALPSRPAQDTDSDRERAGRAAHLADLPAPHRHRDNARTRTMDITAPSSEAPGPSDAQEAPGGVAGLLRGLVGRREKQASPVELAFQALSAIGVTLDPEIRSQPTGADLVAAAEARGALTGKNPLPGDLVVFDGAQGEDPLIGVVAAVHDRSSGRTVEFIYLTRGVVRRGYVTPDVPGKKRDADERALNTHIRHLDSSTPKNAKFLAGELFRTFIRIDRLSAPSPTT